MTERDDAVQEPATPALSAREQLKRKLQQRKAVRDFHTTPIQAGGGEKPLSLAQQRLWLLDRLLGPHAVYNMYFAVHFAGALQREPLRRALETIVARHEVFRTRFRSGESGATLAVEAPYRFELTPEDVHSAADIEAIWRAERGHAFDIAHEPLLRARLLRESASSHVLVVTMHHIVSDAWSLGVFFREFAALYEDYCRGRHATLVPLPLQFSDYARWQRAALSGDSMRQQLSYWKRQLSGLVPMSTLPTDRPRAAEQRFRGGNVGLHVPADTTAALQRLAQAHGATLFMTLLAALAALLGRYAGQQDVAIATPVANRSRREIEELIGFFVNTLVLRTDLGGDPSFAALLGRVRDNTLRAFAHQDVPFESVVEAVNPERSLSYSPLAQVMLILQNAPMPELAFDGLEVRHLDNEVIDGFARLDLTLSLRAERDGLRGVLEYDSDLFERGTIEAMAANYVEFLRSVVLAPERRLGTIDVQPEHERAQLREWNATARAYDLPSLHEAFSAQAQRTPAAIAIEQGEQSIDYAALDSRARGLAGALQARGVG
ncbi:MAG: non-ribosomal peptide synthetase, partial [Rhodanobacteraceae bacterium]|nr:non-ribosomal peptide synthetase [Rhodanobacteraceae bacterium]